MIVVFILTRLYPCILFALFHQLFVIQVMNRVVDREALDVPVAGVVAVAVAAVNHIKTPMNVGDFLIGDKKITMFQDGQNSLPLFVLGRPHDSRPQTYDWLARNKA